MAFTTRQSASEQKSEQEKAAKPSAQLFSDNRASTGIQLKQQQLMQSAQSPAQLESAEDEELLQGKFVAQREGMEEEEPLQGKFETLQRAGEEDELLQGKFTAGQAAQLEQKPNNTGLPNQLKSGIESLSGMSMDNVKVHYNSDKPAQLNAHAYAQGTDIHVAPGQEKHLPHEAWHVVQQAQGRVKPTTQMKGTSVNDDVGLETEADVMGAKAESVKAPTVQAFSRIPLNKTQGNLQLFAQKVTQLRFDAGNGEQWHIHFGHIKLGNNTKSRVEFNGRKKKAIRQELGEKIDRHGLNVGGDLAASFQECINYINANF